MSSSLAQAVSRSDEALRQRVRAAITHLQNRSLAEHRDSDVVARLARLRRAVTAEPGSIPDVWADTVGVVQDEPDLIRYERDDRPSDYERAAHEAITLYALHQQSKSTAVHRDGISLGAAARRLAQATGREDAVRARFHAVAAAETAAGVRHHLRALVTMLRSEGIQLDYARLAVDLRQLHGRVGADRVRLRWGRDFHRAPTDDTGSLSTSTLSDDDHH